MTVTPQLKNQHLLWRAGFGPMAEEYHQLATASHKSYVNSLFKASAKGPEMIDVADNAIKGLIMGVKEVGTKKRNLDEMQRRRIRQQSREDIKSLNITWLNEMVNSEAATARKNGPFLAWAFRQPQYQHPVPATTARYHSPECTGQFWRSPARSKQERINDQLPQQ